jgi:hypothetical protein
MVELPTGRTTVDGGSGSVVGCSWGRRWTGSPRGTNNPTVRLVCHRARSRGILRRRHLFLALTGLSGPSNLAVVGHCGGTLPRAGGPVGPKATLPFSSPISLSSTSLTSSSARSSSPSLVVPVGRGALRRSGRLGRPLLCGRSLTPSGQSRVPALVPILLASWVDPGGSCVVALVGYVAGRGAAGPKVEAAPQGRRPAPLTRGPTTSWSMPVTTPAALGKTRPSS